MGCPKAGSALTTWVMENTARRLYIRERALGSMIFNEWSHSKQTVGCSLLSSRMDLAIASKTLRNLSFNHLQ